MEKKNSSGGKGHPDAAEQKQGRKTISREKVCYKCGEKVSPEATECPKCGATGDASPLWILKVALGFVLGFVLWLIFWR